MRSVWKNDESLNAHGNAQKSRVIVRVLVFPYIFLSPLFSPPLFLICRITFLTLSLVGTCNLVIGRVARVVTKILRPKCGKKCDNLFWRRRNAINWLINEYFFSLILYSLWLIKRGWWLYLSYLAVGGGGLFKQTHADMLVIVFS